MKKAAHRPSRAYPEAPIHRSEVALSECPFCEGKLVSTGSREVDKYVQIMNGPRHVIGYSRKCNNAGCPQPQARYHATSAAKLSLPNVTYGLDVMAYIAYQHDEGNKQFKEIWRELQNEVGLEISEREVGRLYRKIEALLMGNQVAVEQELTATVQVYEQLMMAVDGLQPDGGGPKLYILHEILSGTIISVAMVEQANTDNLVEWLAPWRKWRGVVKATLSDNEQALVTALKETWPEAVHQLCQMHFVKNLSEPVHEADRKLGQAMRDAMGQLPPAPALKRETEEEETDIAHQGDDDSDSKEEATAAAQLSPALMQAMDVVSGVNMEALDTVTHEKWAFLLSACTEAASGSDSSSASDGCSLSAGCSVFASTGQQADESPPSNPAIGLTYLSATETVEQVTQTLLSQVPASTRLLVQAGTKDAPIKEAAVTYWEHTWYRRAIQDARHLGSRKPFRCGGLRGYEQLQAIVTHLAARQAEQGLDAYLSKLQVCAQRAVEQAHPLADDVRQAKDWLIRVERLLADAPLPDGKQRPSEIQRQRMHDLLTKCEEQEGVGETVQALQRTWRRMLDDWEHDLYHCYNIEGLPRSNLGVEALFGQARRQQRRRCGQADTSHLAVTGQGNLRTASAAQSALLELFCQVPAWVYRFTLRCVDAIEARVRWPKQLHKDTAKSLQRFQAQVETLRGRITTANCPP